MLSDPASSKEPALVTHFLDLSPLTCANVVFVFAWIHVRASEQKRFAIINRSPNRRQFTDIGRRRLRCVTHAASSSSSSGVSPGKLKPSQQYTRRLIYRDRFVVIPRCVPRAAIRLFRTSAEVHPSVFVFRLAIFHRRRIVSLNGLQAT